MSSLLTRLLAGASELLLLLLGFLLVSWGLAVSRADITHLRLHLRAGDRASCEACGTMISITLETDIFEGERLLCVRCKGRRNEGAKP